MEVVTTISLTFDGYWRDGSHGGIPATSGVYCVYTCAYNALQQTVSLRKLVYIGESANVRDRIAFHERWPDWRRQRGLGEEVCFSFAPIVVERQRAEAALIFEHKPPLNFEFRNEFPFDMTTMQLAGSIALLHSYFTVYRAAQQLRYW